MVIKIFETTEMFCEKTLSLLFFVKSLFPVHIDKRWRAQELLHKIYKKKKILMVQHIVRYALNAGVI